MIQKLISLMLLTMFLISGTSAVFGVYVTKQGVEQTTFAIRYGIDIGGRTYVCANNTCSPANFTNPEITSEAEWTARNALFTATAGDGRSMLFNGIALMGIGIIGCCFTTVGLLITKQNVGGRE